MPAQQLDLVFGGPGLKIPDLDRMTTQLQKTFALMADGRWRTLQEIAKKVGGSEAGVSARLRDLRKEQAGYHTVHRRRKSNDGGTWEYQLVINLNADLRWLAEEETAA